MQPTAAASFSGLHLSAPIAAAVRGMGIHTPTPIQAEIIPAMLAGRDVVGQARTGSGKTLAFAIPIAERCDATLRGVQALVLTPTRELAIQVGEVVGRLAVSRHLHVALLYGGRSLEPERRALAGGAQIIVSTPGRTLDHLRQGTLKLAHLHLLVLDEADEMLDRGFGPDVERILAFAPAQRQTALFSATVPEWVLRTAARHLRNPVQVQLDQGAESPPEITHRVLHLEPEGKLAALRNLLDHQGPDPIIVFGRTKHGVKKLALQLAKLGYSVAALQGNLSQNARERVMTDFRSGTTRVLVATNVAARGLDIEGVAQIINYDLPDSAQLFTHRAGRTGRMGRAGEAVTFLTPDDAAKWREIGRILGTRLTAVPWRAEAAQPRARRVAPVAADASERRRPIARPALRRTPTRRVEKG